MYRPEISFCFQKDSCSLSQIQLEDTSLDDKSPVGIDTAETQTLIVSCDKHCACELTDLTDQQDVKNKLEEVQDTLYKCYHQMR